MSGWDWFSRVGEVSRTSWGGWLSCLLLAVAIGAGSGCTSWRQGDFSQLSIRSQESNGLEVKGEFDTAVYSFDDRSTMTAVLIDGDPSSPRQAVVVRMFWKPIAGRTPISSRATNATIHYLVFAPSPRDDVPGPVAVYSGAGYVFPRDDFGESELEASLWDATVVLADRSEDFRDVLGPASIRGKFTAEHDETRTLELITRLNQTVSDRLGYPRLVEGSSLPGEGDRVDAASRLVATNAAKPRREMAALAAFSREDLSLTPPADRGSPRLPAAALDPHRTSASHASARRLPRTGR